MHGNPLVDNYSLQEQYNCPGDGHFSGGQLFIDV